MNYDFGLVKSFFLKSFLGTRNFCFLKYKKHFKNGFFSFFELGKVLPEV